MERSTQLTVFSDGAGQDSGAIMLKLIHDPAFRAKYAPGYLLVITSDTGDEFPLTYEHIALKKQMYADAGIEYVHLTADMGFHSDKWISLRQFYKDNDAIGSKAYPKTCTDRLKLGPIYKFLEFWLSQVYGVQCGRKQGFYEFTEKFGKLNVLLGISKGEEKRVAKSQKAPKWYQRNIQPIYPLIEEGMDRQACQDLIHHHGLHIIPSNCMACPFLSLEELEYLRRFHIHHLADWVQLEAAKLEKYRHKENVKVISKTGKEKIVNQNLGVFGTDPLPKKILEAEAKFKHWSNDKVAEYRYSHGHCVATTY